METPSSALTPRMRSSIACARCRRSKIKCMNLGVNTTCKACESSGRECVYPAPAVGGGGGTKREGATAERSEPKRPRVRKTESHATDKGANSASGPKDSTRPVEEALDSSILTPKVWQEVFDLFQLHFATDLPFLHSPTFFAPLCGHAAKLPSTVTKLTPDPDEAEKLPGYEMLLLGLLALTARFHPGLIAYHSAASRNKAADPVAASEYYASALRGQVVGVKGVHIGQPNLEKIQAMLMLGLHEWGMCKGIKAWIHVGLAIRMAQAMGLQFDDDLDEEPWVLSSAMKIEAQHLGVGGSREYPLDPASSEAFIDEEARRRTFWSCFIMDRYLSSGKFRPTMLSTMDVKLQLPSSEHSFMFGERVCTNLITGNCSGSATRVKRKARVFASMEKRGAMERERSVSHTKEDEKDDKDGESDRDEMNIPCEIDSNEGLLSRFIRMVEIWGKIAKWTCAGGRRIAKRSPWNPASTFYQLRESLSKFHDTIPRPLRLTPNNMQAHLSQRTSSPFTLLHTLYCLGLIVLHREYVPFVPLRCDRPEGPLDDPMPQEHKDAPIGFWEESARQIFKAGRDMMDLVQACQSRDMLVETPILGFGLYNVAFVGVYAINFPHMDQDGYMCGRGGEPEDTAGGYQAARKALETIGQMRARLPMATNWFRTIHRVHRYYEKIIGDYRANTQALKDSLATNTHGGQMIYRQLSLREGGNGNGRESYKLLEKTLKEFGSIEDEEVEIVSGDREKMSQRASFNGSNGGDQVPKLEHHLENWTAINSTVSSDHEHETPSNRTPAPENLPDRVEPQSTFSNSNQPHLARSRQSISTNPPSSISTEQNSTPTSSLPPPSPYQRTEFGPAVPQHAHSQLHQQSSHHQQSQLGPQTQSHLVHSSHQQPHSTAYISHSLPPPQPPYSSLRPPQVYDSSVNLKSPHSLQQPSRPSDAAAVNMHNTNTNSSRFWSQEMQDGWLNSLRKPLGGDDVAAFVDGRSCEEWGHFNTPMVGYGTPGADG